MTGLFYNTTHMEELRKELLQKEEWLPNLGLMGVLDSLDQLKLELEKFNTQN